MYIESLMEKERDTLDLPPSSDLGPLGQPVSLHFLQALPVLLCMWLKVSNRKKRTEPCLAAYLRGRREEFSWIDAPDTQRQQINQSII